ncbi:MAG: radical SAM protein [Erysipelotrichaceae bacterium]
MIKRFYIEIINYCNLKCSFCLPNSCLKQIMGIDDFEKILVKINDNSKYIYLHIKGDPLLHPNLIAILDICYKYQKRVVIVTNGTLVNEATSMINSHPAVFKISISLHGILELDNYHDYLDNLKDFINNRQCNMELRLWTIDKLSDDKRIAVYEFINQFTDNEIKTGYDIKLDHQLYLSFDKQFVWPDLSNKYYQGIKNCPACKLMLCILVNGDVSVCCLDHNGLLKIGNIYENSMEEILNCERYLKIKQGFMDNKAIEELCRHCSY